MSLLQQERPVVSINDSISIGLIKPIDEDNLYCAILLRRGAGTEEVPRLGKLGLKRLCKQEGLVVVGELLHATLVSSVLIPHYTAVGVPLPYISHDIILLRAKLARFVHTHLVYRLRVGSLILPLH